MTVQGAQEGTCMKPGHLKVPAPSDCCRLGFEDLPPEVCQSVGDVLARVGDKWSILVIHMLSRRTLRFRHVVSLVKGSF